MKPTTLARALACVALAAAAGTGGCTGGLDDLRPAGGGASPVRIRVVENINTDVRDVPLHMAFDTLRAAGFDVQQISVGANDLQGAALAQGDADVGVLNNQTAWSAIASGADIRTVSAFTGYTGIIAARTGIECRDVDRRVVGLPNATGFSPLLFDLLMQRKCPGVTPQRLVITEAAARTAALLSGRLDVSMVPSEEFVKLQRLSGGRFYVLASAAGDYPEIQVEGIHVRRRWAREHPEAVRALVAAQIEAYRSVRANPDVLYRESIRRLGLDAAAAKAIADAHLAQDLWDADGGLTRENIALTIAFLVGNQALPRALDPDEVADLSYLEDVLRTIGRVDAAIPRSTHVSGSPVP